MHRPHLALPWKSLLLAGAFILLSHGGWAQEPDLEAINRQRLKLNQTHMLVLGGWAVGNILTGLALKGQATGSTRYFHEMNVFWNLVNLGLAGGGLYAALTTDPGGFDLWQTYHEQQKLEKIILFNCALNVGYMAAGAYLTERARRGEKQAERWKGYGRSLVLQGAFLLIFDAVQYGVHHSHAQPALKVLLTHVHPTSTGLAITWQF